MNINIVNYKITNNANVYKITNVNTINIASKHSLVMPSNDIHMNINTIERSNNDSIVV